MRRDTGCTKTTRVLVLERDEYHCCLCGEPLADWPGYSLQHRRSRSMGGSRLADTNSPSNLATCCGSATTGCHGFLEAAPDFAAEYGFRVRQSQTPAEVPLRHAIHGWVFLNDDGSVTPVVDRILPPEDPA